MNADEILKQINKIEVEVGDVFIFEGKAYWISIDSDDKRFKYIVTDLETGIVLNRFQTLFIYLKNIT